MTRPAVDAYSFACPTCGARMGEWCRGRDQHNPHAARRSKVRRALGQSVAVKQVVSSYFESNRRRH